MKRFTRNSYPGILCAAVILLLTGLPGSYFPHVKPVIGMDKVAHLLMYAGFTFISLWGYREPFVEKGSVYRKKAVWIAIVIGITYGALTEIMQETLIPSRTGSVYDWIADLVGSVLGAIIAYFFLCRRNNLKNASLDK